MYICTKQTLQTLVLLFFMLFSITAHADKHIQRFSSLQFGTEEGLNSLRVFSIATDKSGAIWMGTLDGINRFNGRSMKSYKLGTNQRFSDASGSTTMLTISPNNSLYAYNNVGRIYRYNLLTDQFELYLDLAEHIYMGLVLHYLFIDSQEQLWIGLNSGLYCCLLGETPQLIDSDCHVTYITELPQSMAIGTTCDLRIYSKDRNLLQKLCPDTYVQSLLPLPNKEILLIGTFNCGVKSISLSSWQEQPVKNGSLPHTPIRSMIEMTPSTVLLGFDGDGVYTYNLSSGEAEPLFTRTNRMLTAMGVYSLCRDCEDNIWIGTYTGGAFLMMPEETSTTLLRHRKGEEPSLADDNVNAFCEQSNGELWIATDNGISIYNPPNNRCRQILPGNVVLSISIDSQDIIAAGTYGNGVFLLNSQGEILHHYLSTNSSLPSDYLSTVQFDTDRDLWIGTMDNQLLQLEHPTRQWKSYNVIKARCIAQKDAHTIAVGTVDGLVLINKQTGKQAHIFKSTDNKGEDFNAFIQSIAFIDDEQAWLGSDGGGLYLCNLQTLEKRAFSTEQRLPSNRVSALLIDHSKMLWITTDHGLACLPPQPSMQIYNQNFEHVMSRFYNRSAAILLADGRVALGSTTGVLIFKPHISLTSYQAPSLQLTNFRIDNIDSRESTDMRPELMQMLADSTITLSYRHNSFTIGFESVSFRYQEDIAYEYMLEGFDRDWNKLENNEQLRYTNVSPGKYQLCIRSYSLNSGLILSNRTTSITICQPWWNTWWAWLLYTITLCGIIGVIIKSKQQQLVRHYMNEKIAFFVSIAHDIRTPLTLVKAPLDELRQDSTLHADAIRSIGLAHSNLNKLLDILSQLLDFERIDHSSMNPKMEAVPLKQNIDNLFTIFQPLCQQQQKTLQASSINCQLGVWADSKLLDRILTNLLSNALKYTPAGGKISIDVKAEADKVQIIVSDTGIGISPKEQKKLFTSFFRASNAISSGTPGIGLGLLQAKRFATLLKGDIKVNSIVNQGSEFMLILNKAAVTGSAVPTTTPITKDFTTTENTTLCDSDKDTLLIVEDHETLRHYLRQTFEHLYRVIDVADGHEAIACLANEYPDIILSDVMMPGIRGDELCRMVKENPDTSGIPVVLLTAKANHEAIVEGLKKGADDYIPKPFSTEILKLKVQGLIDNRNRQRQFFMRQAIAQVETGGKRDDNESNENNESIDNKNVTTASETMAEGDRRFIMQATRFVLEHLDEPDFNINLLCHEMAMSRTLFYSRLKSLTGKGPQEFIRIIRLQKAAELLKEGKSVTDVAAETGFVNTKYFSSLFKKQFGMQPSKYSGK